LAATLHEMLLAPDVKPQVVADCRALVKRELDSKSGVSGTAIKIAYKAITAFAPGYYTGAVESMLPDMTDRLQPFWADFIASGGSEFGDYLAKRSDEVSEALLSVTDDMRNRSARPTVIKTYNAVRNGAGKHIEAALPNLGAMVQKYG
jgi:hypothetical protein